MWNSQQSENTGFLRHPALSSVLELCFDLHLTKGKISSPVGQTTEETTQI